MQTTTPQQLEAAFIAAIHEITPTYEHERSQTWHYSEDALEIGILGQDLRNFTLDLGPAVPTSPGEGFHGTGETFVFTVAVRASYKGVPARELSHMITADAVDLRTALDDLRDPTAPGLYSLAFEGIENDETDDVDAAALDFMFRVVYYQDT